jgi:hypothetical protein
MTTVNKYRFYCESENAYKTVWGESPPTKCPDESTHTIDEESITIVNNITENDVRVKSKTTNASFIDNNVFVDGAIKIDLLKTAFEDLSVSQIYPVVQNDFTFSVNPDIINSTTTGVGSVTQDHNMAVISTGASADSSASLASERIIRYKPGMGVRALFTAIYSQGVEGNVQLGGIGNDDDGCFFGFNGPDFGIVRRYDGVDYWTPQSEWNIDTMDGNGLSGQVLDPTKGNIYMIQMQWLGFGAIRFFIEEKNSGRIHPVHIIRYANTHTQTSLCIPIFNMYLSNTNTTNTTDIQLKCPCIAAFIEGTIHRILGPRYGIDNDKFVSVNEFTNILTIHVKTTFNSKKNKIPIQITNMSASTSSKPTVVVLIKNASLSGTPIWQDIATGTDVVEYDTNTTTLTGGRSIMTFCIGPGNGISQYIDPYAIVLEPGNTLTLAARVPSGENTSVSGALNWISDH